jgi:hypothetical protein
MIETRLLYNRPLSGEGIYDTLYPRKMKQLEILDKKKEILVNRTSRYIYN